ncbi:MULTISPECIES: stage II sporulation protein P [unclassified Clostridium]|uniref:stage II sporulation protein P n=1 Tax=unclassified Clostridium TaxID=2614128 RepID=UPI0011075CAE|nr:MULTISPECIES: stage II sporulation protein P [unclassified Clostridium]
MIRIKVWKITQILYYLAVVALAILVLVLLAGLWKGSTDHQSQPSGQPASGVVTAMAAPPEGGGPGGQALEEETLETRQTGAQRLLRSFFYTRSQQAARAEREREQNVITPASNLAGCLRNLLGLTEDPASFLTLCMPQLNFGPAQAAAAKGDDTQLALTTSAQSGQGDGQNADDGAEHGIVVEIATVQEEPQPQQPAQAPVQGEGEPYMLVYHTHTTEAYTKTEANTYADGDGEYRTTDNNYNVVRVGEQIINGIVARTGLNIIHDTTNHEPPKHGTAYVRSLQTMENQKAAHPSLEMFLDVHRDAYITGERAAEYNGQPIAQIQFVVGTGEGQTGAGFSVKPDWEKNYALAQQITDELNRIAPGVAKPIRKSTSRYNQHVSNKALLVEVGHNKNTLEETLAAADLLSEAMSNVLNAQRQG